MLFSKKRIASILTALMIINIFAVFLMPQEVYGTTAAWQELRGNIEGTLAFNVGGSIVFVSKANVTVSGDGINWSSNKIANAKEIQAGYKLGNTFFLMTNKDSAKTIYKSMNGGENWSSITSKDNVLGSNKIEGILALNDQQIFVVVEKSGVFYSSNGGENWSAKNGTGTNILPPNPEKASEGDARVIVSYDGKLYVGNKKSGVYVSHDYGDNWTPVNDNNGLTGNAREVFDILVEGNTLYIGTKSGVWSTDITNQNDVFTQVAGLSGEAKRLNLVEGRVYSITKENKIYYMKGNKFEEFNNKPSNVSPDEFKTLDYYDGYFYATHKKGLLKIQDAFKPIDKTTLLSLIVTAQARVAAAIEGTGVGQYPLGTKAALSSTIDIASIIYNEANSTEVDINMALNLLTTAMATFDSSRNPDEWHLLNSDDSLNVVTVNGKSLLITKNSVLLSRSSGGWDTKLSGIKEIGATFVYGSSIYLIGNNDGNPVFFKSGDNGDNFVNQLQNGKTLPSGIGENKIEGILVVDNDKLYIVVEKKGVYYSNNDGSSWTLVNNTTLPANSEAKKIWKYDNKFYVSTKKQGVYESEDGVTWSIVKSNQGLSSEKEKEVSDLLAVGDMLYIATKEGIYRTNTKDTNGWTKLTGITGEVRGLQLANGKVYAIVKESKIFYLDNTDTFRAFTNQPSGVTLEEFRGFTFDGQVFLVAGKKGLLRIVDDYKEMNLATIAASITNISNPVVNATTLTLPTVPTGYYIEIVQSSDEGIIDLDGNISLRDTITTVALILEITKLADGTTARTVPLTVTIPAKVTAGDKDGVYEGTGKGKNGSIKISVVIVGGKIVAINVLEHKESISHNTYGVPVTKALTELPQNIISSQTIDVDTVTNATVTSNGIKEAVLNALKETSYYKPLEDEWKSYSIDSNEGVEVFAVNGKYIYVTKKDEKSNVYLVSNNGDYVRKLSNIGEIDTGYRVPNTNTVYLIGRKEGNALFVSHDGGESWSQPIKTVGIGSEKIEALRVINQNEMYISVSKFGLYKSLDGGVNWELFNNNLPKNPEKNTEYDTRKLWLVNNEWYIGTKKQGLLTSTDGLNWKAFKTTGLSSDGKDVWDLLIKGNDIFINTKAGVWATNLNDSSPWVKVSGFSGEGRRIVEIDGRLYAFAKNGNSYYLEDNTFKVMLPTPSGISIDDVRGLDYSNGHFILAHKAGLVRMKDILKPSDTDTDTGATQDVDTETGASSGSDTTSGASSIPVLDISETDGEKPTNVRYNERVLVSDVSIQKTNNDIQVRLTKEKVSNILKENTGVRVIEIPIKENFNTTVVKLEGEGFKELGKQDVEIHITFTDGSYVIPSKLIALEEISGGMGNLISLILSIEKIDIASDPTRYSQLLVHPVKFSLEAEFTRGIFEIKSFGKQFIQRSLIVPKEINIKKATGVVFEDGVWKTVPTTFNVVEGRTIALIKRNSNSIYSVMEGEVNLSDIIGHWSKESVEILAAKRIIQGNEGKYSPDGILTRGQFATMLVRSLGLKNAENKTLAFKDVEAGSWYEDFIYTAVNFGIVQGNLDGTFKPDKEISREEMVVMIMRAIGIVEELEDRSKEDSYTSKWLDGVYEGEGRGFKSDIKVNITIQKGYIQSIKVVENGDSIGIGDIAAAGMVNRIVRQQSTMVDTYTGATASSKGLLEAVNKAIDKALNKDIPVTNAVEAPKTESILFKDDARISSWAFDAVYKAVDSRIVGGYEDITFRPQNTSTRAEAAIVIIRMLEALNFISR